MSFLPENYQPPASSAGSYLKLQTGTNQLRILSRPIIGWEMWVNDYPQRYPFDQKPEPIGDTKPREFWSMIVWFRGYKEEKSSFVDVDKLMIWHVTQGSIKKAIRDLSQEEVWGSPHQYDLKISKTGHQLKTSYSITPNPKSDLSEEIKKAFKDTPICLEALFLGEDPFSFDGAPTSPIWDLKQSGNIISLSQYKEIMDYIGDDEDYLKKVTDGIKNSLGVDLKKLPATHFEKVLKQVKLHSQERLKKEQSFVDDLPF